MAGLNIAHVFVYYTLMSLAVSKEHQFAGQLAVFATAFLWSTSGLFIKMIDWHPMVIAGTRAFGAAVFLIVVRMIFPVPKSVKGLAFPFWASAITNSLTVITFVVANKLTASANVVLLQYSSPVWTALLGWWLIKEKPRWEHWGALVLVAGGLLIFLHDGLGSGSLLGNGVAVSSGIFVGFNMVFLRMAKEGNLRDALLMSHVLTTVISIPFIFLYPPTLSASSVLPIVYMGPIQQGLASIFFAYGIKRVSAIQAILTATIEPLCNPLWVLLVIGEKPSFQAIIGGGLIFAAVVSSSIIGKQREAGNLPGKIL